MQWLRAFALAAAVAFAGTVDGQEMRKSCKSADFVWTQASEPDTGRAENPGLLFLPIRPGESRVVLLGPVLGSMDAAEITSAITCTRNGALLTAVSMRSREFSGGAHKNILRRARMVISVTLHEPEVRLEAEWLVRSTDGTILDRVQTPPYPELHYPLRATIDIHR